MPGYSQKSEDRLFLLPLRPLRLLMSWSRKWFEAARQVVRLAENMSPNLKGTGYHQHYWRCVLRPLAGARDEVTR